MNVSKPNFVLSFLFDLIRRLPNGENLIHLINIIDYRDPIQDTQDDDGVYRLGFNPTKARQEIKNVS